MKIKLAVLTAAYALLSIGTATAADQPENNQPAPATEQTTPASPVDGFGSGTGIGRGGGIGSASSVVDGFGSPVSGSGAGSQIFGGGFDQQQTAGSGPLSTSPAAGAGGGAGGPLAP